MQVISVGAAVVGYIVACLIHGRLLPAFSEPSFIGVFVSQVVVFGLALLIKALPDVQQGSIEDEKRAVKNQCPYCRKVIPKKDQDEEASAIKCGHCLTWIDNWQSQLL